LNALRPGKSPLRDFGKSRAQKNTGQPGSHFVSIKTSSHDAAVSLQPPTAAGSPREFPVLSATNAQARRIRQEFFATVRPLPEGINQPFRRRRMDLDSRGE